jgi:hypothetical protein
VRRQIVEFQRLDVRERAGGFEARNIRSRRADIDDDLIAGEQSGAAVVQGDLDGLGPIKRPPMMSSAPLLLYAPGGS